MTVATSNNRVEYTGNGVTKAFSFPNKFFADSDLVVVLQVTATGVPTTQVLTTDYTVSGAGDDAGGTVTFVTAPASTETVIIYRDPAMTQSIDMVNGDAFDVDTTVERMADRGVLQVQRIKELALRSLRLADDDVSTGVTLPTKVDRASMYLTFDANGEPSVASGTGADAGLRADLASTASTTLGDFLVGLKRTLTNAQASTLHKFNEKRHVYLAVDYLAAEDGATDDSTALNNAITDLSTAGGGVIYISADCAVASTVVLKSNVLVMLLNGAQLIWTGSTTGTMFDNGTSGALIRAGFIGDVDFSAATGAGTCFKIRSAFQCVFDSVVTGASATSTIWDITVNTAGTANAYGNYNTAFNIFLPRQLGTCGTFIKLTGASGTPTVVTLNEFRDAQCQSAAVRGVDLVEYCDTNFFTGMTRLGIGADGAVGVEHNTSAPTSNKAVYSNNFQHLAIATFGSYTSRVGIKMNSTKGNRVDYYFNEPAADGGAFVENGYALSYRICMFVGGTNNMRIIEKGSTVSFHAKISTAQTFTGAKTKVDFGTQVVDNGDSYDPTTSTFTAPADGRYSFTVSLSNTTGVTATDVWQLTLESAGGSAQTLLVNGYVIANSVGACPLQLSGELTLDAGDTVICYVTRVSGAGNYVELNNANANYFMGRLMT